MSDLIDREEAIKTVNDWLQRVFAITIDGQTGIEHRLRHIKSMDAVEVVRCKDCKYYKNEIATPFWLPCYEFYPSPEWFCANGERKEAEDAKIH